MIAVDVAFEHIPSHPEFPCWLLLDLRPDISDIPLSLMLSRSRFRPPAPGPSPACAHRHWCSFRQQGRTESTWYLWQQDGLITWITANTVKAAIENQSIKGLSFNRSLKIDHFYQSSKKKQFCAHVDEQNIFPTALLNNLLNNKLKVKTQFFHKSQSHIAAVFPYLVFLDFFWHKSLLVSLYV